MTEGETREVYIYVCMYLDISIYSTNKYTENNTWSRRDMEFIFECSHPYRRSERSKQVRH